MSQIQAFSGSDVNVMARPTWNNPVEIKRLLDAGVSGLVIPMVNTVEEAELAVKSNAHALARYAALVQEAKMVPIVEPEVLMDGNHDIMKCYEVTSKVLPVNLSNLVQCL